MYWNPLCVRWCTDWDTRGYKHFLSPWSSPSRGYSALWTVSFEGGLRSGSLKEWRGLCQWTGEKRAFQFSSVAQSCPTLCDPMDCSMPGPPCPSPTPRVYSDSCPSTRWCHPAVSSFVIPFSSFPQPLPTSESFPMSQPFAWGGQSIAVSALASVLPMNTQDWSL